MNKRKITSLALVTLLFTGSILQVGCGRATTLDKVGRVAVALARGFAAEVKALKDAGLSGPKITAAENAAKKLTAAADSLNGILEGAKTINERDAAAVAGFVGVISSTIGALLQNADFLGLGENSLIVKVAKYISIAVTQLSLTLAIYFPPPVPGQVGVSSAASKTIATSKITIDLPEPPPEVKALLNK